MSNQCSWSSSLHLIGPLADLTVANPFSPLVAYASQVDFVRRLSAYTQDPSNPVTIFVSGNLT